MVSKLSFSLSITAITFQFFFSLSLLMQMVSQISFSWCKWFLGYFSLVLLLQKVSIISFSLSWWKWFLKSQSFSLLVQMISKPYLCLPLQTVSTLQYPFPLQVHFDPFFQPWGLGSSRVHLHKSVFENVWYQSY